MGNKGKIQYFGSRMPPEGPAHGSCVEDFPLMTQIYYIYLEYFTPNYKSSVGIWLPQPPHLAA